MRLVLINPPEKTVVRANLPATIEELRGANPSIGLFYVAGAAKRAKNWEIKLIDAHAENLDYTQTAQRAFEFKPELIGITFNTFTYLDAINAARAVKRKLPDVPVLAGGVQPLLSPEETLSQPEFDAIFSGEADLIFHDILEQFERGGLIGLARAKIEGLAVKGNDMADFHHAPLIKELDEIPMPAWELSPYQKYSSLITPHKPVMLMMTTRGCPYRCRYCSLSATGKIWRAHSANRVVDEMVSCQKLGIKYLLFYDEIFTVSRKRIFEICERIGAIGLKIPWMARGTVDTVDYEELLAMKRAGCHTATFGVESGSERILEVLGRKQNLAKASETFRAAKKAGLSVIAYFMIGTPTETLEDVKASMRLANKLDLNHVHASIFIPYPASDIYEDALRSGVIKSDYWRLFAVNPKPDFVSPFWTENFSEQELQKLLFKFYRGFYMRPTRALKKAFMSIKELKLKLAFNALKALLRGS